jgi:hypothetical protein
MNDRYRLRQGIAGSPDTPRRNGFTLLRTGLSLSIALHHPSLDVQLCSATGPLRRPDEGLHLAYLVHSRAHDTAPLALGKATRTPADRPS